MPVLSDGHNGNLVAPNEGCETRAQRLQSPGFGPCPFRKYQDDLAALQSTKRLLQPTDTRTVAIDGYRIQHRNDASDGGPLEQCPSRKKIHATFARNANEDRVEQTLVIHADQRTALQRDCFAAEAAKAKAGEARGSHEDTSEIVEQPSSNRSCGHGALVPA